MTTTSDEVSLADAFTREHHQIDAGIAEYLASAEPLPGRAVPLLSALEALRRHIYLEEVIVFPHLPQGMLMMPLMIMMREHGELWRHMDDLTRRLEDEAAPAADLEAACTELLQLLDNHNMKEEPVIYPHMDADLDEHEQARVRALLQGASLPSGWVCQEA